MHKRGMCGDCGRAVSVCLVFVTLSDTMTICCCTTPSNVARSTLEGGNVTTHQTCAGSQRQSVTHSLPPLWFLVTSRTVSTNLQLFTLASNFPSSEESNAEDGTSGKLVSQCVLRCHLYCLYDLIRPSLSLREVCPLMASWERGNSS